VKVVEEVFCTGAAVTVTGRKVISDALYVSVMVPSNKALLPPKVLVQTAEVVPVMEQSTAAVNATDPFESSMGPTVYFATAGPSVRVTALGSAQAVEFPIRGQFSTYVVALASYTYFTMSI
jgi:hypothetical protein